MPSLERQLRLLRAYACCSYPFACAPFLFLYFAQHGLDQAAYGEVIAAYYLAMFLAEVPTGILADRYGPKPLLILGPCLLALGFAMLWLFPSYHGFLAGELLLGFAHAVLSGPPATILYETLRAHGQQQLYLQEEARCNKNRLLGTGVAFLCGGALVRYGNQDGDAYGLAIVATCIGNLLAAVLALGLRPAQGRPALPLREFFAHLRHDINLPAVRWLLGYWIVLFALLRFPFHNYQPYLQAAGNELPLLLDPLCIGILFALLNLAAAPMSSRLPWLVARWGRRALFYAMPLLLAASLLVLGVERSLASDGNSSSWLVGLGIAMFFLQQLPYGMHTALLAEFINHRVDPAARTTVLSLLSLAARLAYAACNVLLFRAQQEWGMAMACWLAGGAGGILALLSLQGRPRGLLRND